MKKNQGVGIRFTVAERKLLDTVTSFMEDEFMEKVRATPVSESVFFSPEEWEHYSGYLAFEANHCEEKKRQRVLDDLIQKIEQAN